MIDKPTYQELEHRVKELEKISAKYKLAEKELNFEEGTDHKKTEEALRETRDYLENLINYANAPIIVWDTNFKITRFNNAFEKLTGRSSQEVVGQKLDILFPETSCNDSLVKIGNTLQGEKWESVEIPILRADGDIRIALWNSANIYGKDGNTHIATIAQGQDITDRKKTEEQLRKSKEEWEKTFDAMGDIVTIQDKDMRIVRANKAAYQFFQAKYGELNGKHCYEVFTGKSEPCSGCPLSETLHGAKPHSAIMTHENLGKTFLVSSSAITTENGELQYLIHVAKDITEQKRLEEELFQAHKMEAIGTLAGGIAHDFNNILSAIIGFSELAKDDIPADSKATKDINQVLKASRRASDLVQQILTFSRKSDQRIEPMAPHLIIKEALKMLRSSLPTTINMVGYIDNECGKIMANPTNIHQIIVNLCTNSLHAMENEKGILSVSLQREEVSAEEISGEPDVSPGPFIVLEVTDTGQGMDQATIERIFDPYFTTKEVGKGTGLGLAVIHGIIQDYHGFVRVKSKLGQGTTFSVHIPALQQEISTPDETKTNEPLPTGTERILVVDDENMIVSMNKTVLERLGYKVTATTDSLEALDKIRNDPDQFDMIITDQTMPNLTGAELAQEILKIKPSMPIILCTGYSSVLSEEDALLIGIKKYARKPVDRTTLAKTVRQVLDDK